MPGRDPALALEVVGIGELGEPAFEGARRRLSGSSMSVGEAPRRASSACGPVLAPTKAIGARGDRAGVAAALADGGPRPTAVALTRRSSGSRVGSRSARLSSRLRSSVGGDVRRLGRREDLAASPASTIRPAVVDEPAARLGDPALGADRAAESARVA